MVEFVQALRYLPFRNFEIFGMYEIASEPSRGAQAGSLHGNALPHAPRQWLAELALRFVQRPAKTVLMDIAHSGPLRVQKPFYPESDGCCHVYLLHPPGGLVAGDQLRIAATLEQNSQALITTPSAGKAYGTKNLTETQGQHCQLHVAPGATLEWLPQETIIFDGARAHLHTRIDLEADGKLFVWDIVRLGRAQSGERFTQGYCQQRLEIWRDRRPVFIERNHFEGGSDLQAASWGLRGCNTSATLCATVVLPKKLVDECVQVLASKNSAASLWGLTQKKGVFVARYLGDSVAQCREGYEYLWQVCRPILSEKAPVVPRIWRT